MNRVFNLSELMVGGFGVSDPVTGGVETYICQVAKQVGNKTHSNSKTSLQVELGLHEVGAAAASRVLNLALLDIHTDP